MKLNFELIKLTSERAARHPDATVALEEIASISGIKVLPSTNLTSEAALQQEIQDNRCPVLLLTPQEILDNGTACGSAENNCFTQEVVNFLVKQKVKEIFTAVSYYPDEGYKILGGSLKLKERQAEKLSSLIDKYDGSWRFDSVSDDGWASFETE